MDGNFMNDLEKEVKRLKKELYDTKELIKNEKYGYEFRIKYFENERIPWLEKKIALLENYLSADSDSRTDLVHEGKNEYDIRRGIYTAQRMDNGELVEGNLICQEGSPFAYILTADNFKHMCVDESNNGKTECNLIRVLKHSIR